MSERIDLVDSTGNVIKTDVKRDDAEHYDGLHMQIIIAVITNADGELLVHKRSMSKRVNPGDIDHVCGGMYAGETPEHAAQREALEEGGVTLDEIEIVRQGINPYNRYCYLIRGKTTNMPDPSSLDPDEVEWAAFYSHEYLQAKQQTGEFTFVDGFFEDIEYAGNRT